MDEKPIAIKLPNNIECIIESTDAAIKIRQLHHL